MITDLAPTQLNTLWSHLRSRHKTRSATAEAFLSEISGQDPTDILMACLDRRGDDWDAIISALMNKPLYKCAPGETAFPLTDAKGQRIATPRGHRYGSAPVVEEPLPSPPPATRARKRDPRIITHVEPNPKLEGSKAHERYSLYTVGMTVDQFLDQGGRKTDVSYDVSRGYIKLGYEKNNN